MIDLIKSIIYLKKILIIYPSYSYIFLASYMLFTTMNNTLFLKINFKLVANAVNIYTFKGSIY